MDSCEWTSGGWGLGLGDSRGTPSWLFTYIYVLFDQPVILHSKQTLKSGLTWGKLVSQSGGFFLKSIGLQICRFQFRTPKPTTGTTSVQIRSMPPMMYTWQCTIRTTPGQMDPMAPLTAQVVWSVSYQYRNYIKNNNGEWTIALCFITITVHSY